MDDNDAASYLKCWLKWCCSYQPRNALNSILQTRTYNTSLAKTTNCYSVFVRNWYYWEVLWENTKNKSRKGPLNQVTTMKTSFKLGCKNWMVRLLLTEIQTCLIRKVSLSSFVNFLSLRIFFFSSFLSLPHSSILLSFFFRRRTSWWAL